MRLPLAAGFANAKALHVLALVIRYDTSDWATSFIPVWMGRLAAHVGALDVVALHVGEVGALPSNMRVYSMGKEHGVGRAGLLANYYRHMLRLTPRADTIFVHMIPRYALLAAPIAKPLNKPLTLWYTHREPSPDLKRALPLVDRVVTAVPSSFPLPTDKMRALGHGIDADFYAPGPASSPQPPTIVQVARLQRIKNQGALIAATRDLSGAQVLLVGDVPDGEDDGYPAALRAAAGANVTFTGGLPAATVRDTYRTAAVAVNLSPPGLFDKAALESMACGVPTVVCNPAFDDLLSGNTRRLRVGYPVEPDELAATLRGLLALPDDARAEIGRGLRERVQAAHSLDALIPRLAGVLRTGEVPS